MNEIRPDAAPPQVDVQKHQDDVAELCPPLGPNPPRRLVGRMRGKIWMADDFDTWPEGFIKDMVNGPIFPSEDKEG